MNSEYIILMQNSQKFPGETPSEEGIKPLSLISRWCFIILRVILKTI